jgi:hypothetical protein
MGIVRLPPEPATLADVDSCHSLCLESLSEPSRNQLLLIVVEEMRHGPVHDLHLRVGAVIPSVQAVGPTAGGRAFEVFWQSYVAYSVRNESYVYSTGQESVGQRFRVYTRSHFGDYVKQTTWANDELPGPLTHWSVLCRDHIIDVIAAEAPVLTLVGEIR